ncbi:TauD/TfdA family dioxygenase [Nocardia pseudobrasiliensis]|uniref:TfdA family taurine catabolism dioxygenase TauD n=1 Tax=Nocardia pseudobrasiliensis TaxID=45979 RepID=A0A370IBP0_9NOCA|nr:TauD/TfdA family dioxygenase [Nocardia pseudobrasiliensis]RDI68127.1 TfdA family taurine catabolism dioxygenase TauD [Nocardia pseudobrasiliensis]
MIPTPPIDVTGLDPITARVENNGPTAALVCALGDDVDDPLAWLRAHREHIDAALHGYGAVLLRGLPPEMSLFEEVVTLIGGRTEIGVNIDTSTEYRPDERIPMHNEDSHAASWPRLLFFMCETPAEWGGYTPIADSRSVFQSLPQDLLERFAHGVRYTRTYRDDLGLGWREAFQTDSRAKVERYCREHGMAFSWDGPRLLTSTTRPAWRDEPRSGARVWFNQANLFHLAALGDEVREALLEAFPERYLARNAHFGNGTPIPPEDLLRVEQTYDDCALTLPWHRGDLLIIVNMLMAHGRTPYRGARRIWVATA